MENDQNMYFLRGLTTLTVHPFHTTEDPEQNLQYLRTARLFDFGYFHVTYWEDLQRAHFILFEYRTAWRNILNYFANVDESNHIFTVVDTVSFIHHPTSLQHSTAIS